VTRFLGKITKFSHFSNLRAFLVFSAKFWRRFYGNSVWSKKKLQILVKKGFGQKSKFWSKIEILVKNRNFGQKWIFWTRIEIFIKNRNFGQNCIFWTRIEILIKNRNFGEKIIGNYVIFIYYFYRYLVSILLICSKFLPFFSFSINLIIVCYIFCWLLIYF